MRGLQTAAFDISHHHTIDINPFTATVMDCIAEIGMDPQGVQKCVAVSVIFQIIQIFFADGPFSYGMMMMMIARDGD